MTHKIANRLTLTLPKPDKILLSEVFISKERKCSFAHDTKTKNRAQSVLYLAKFQKRLLDVRLTGYIRDWNVALKKYKSLNTLKTHLKINVSFNVEISPCLINVLFE
jgi:hypothetical protein